MLMQRKKLFNTDLNLGDINEWVPQAS